MLGLFHAQGRLASRHPWWAIAVIALLTIGFGAGFAIDSGPGGDQAESFLPPGSDLAVAQAKIAKDFASQSTTVGVQVIVRGGAGDVLSPAGLQEVLDAFADVAAHPDVEPFLLSDAMFSPAHLLLLPLGASDYTGVTRAEIESAVDVMGEQIQGLLACDARPCSVATTTAMLGVVSLDGDVPPAQEQALIEAQLGIEEALDDVVWDTVEARSFSSAKLNKESNEAQGASTNLLMGIALGIILVLLVVFYRTGSDVVLSIGGLVLTLVWVFGAQGWLGPGALGVIGADSPLAMMIPILLIGLTVDYALQVTGRYREHLSEGEQVRGAMHRAVRYSGMPLLLAAGTTAISFLTNVTSSLPPMQDFGIVAALGVVLGWFIMITFVPAVRTLLDAQRERKGKRVQDRHMADAIPGINRSVVAISHAITHRPAIFVAVATVVSVAAFVGAANVSTTFNETDFLPENTESYEDIVFLGDAFQGGESTATLLIEGELTQTDTLRALVGLELTLADETSRPEAMTGPVRASVLTLAFDLAADDGTPGDAYDPEVGALLQELDHFFVPADALRTLFSYLQEQHTEAFAQVVHLHPATADHTIIVIPISSGDPAATRDLVDRIQKAWTGDPDDLYITGGEILSVAINDELTESQTQSVTITVLAALGLLVLFFGITEKRPALGFITVLPIGLVVGWVLGTMYLLGISYNVMTALITALTIGVGVDYTIHVTHRFLEEHAEGKGIAHAVQESLSTTGGALIGSALTTALGFGVLLFSPLTPMQQFGGLTALTILYSLIAAFVVLPPLLVVWALFHEWRAKQLPASKLVIETAPIRNAQWIIAGVTGTEGTPLRCPKCKQRTFVPIALPALRCPTYGCTFESKNPHHQTD